MMASSFVSEFEDDDRDEDIDSKQVKMPKTGWTHHHVVAFLLTFLSYSLIHAIRKTFSNVKYSLVSTWTPQNATTYETLDEEIWESHHLFNTDQEAEYFLGILNASFMFSYATGLYISGALGDRIDPRIVLGIGMWGTAIVNFLFGYVMELYHFYSISAYVILWVLNGLLQSCDWPAEVCIMGNWFGRSSRGLVLGVWSACTSVGNIIGSYSAASVLPYGYEGLYISGALGDRIDPRIVLGIGMWGTAIVNFLFGYVMELYHFYSISAYVILWVLNGLLQSCDWPAEVCIMGNWFGRSSRGLVLGVWSACTSVGNIIGSYSAASVLPYGYEYAFLVNSAVLFAFAFVVFFGVISAPRDIGMPDTMEHDSSDLLLPKQNSSGRPYAIDFCHAILLPGVVAYSLAYACLKSVNYSIFFWLPYYMTNALGWKETVADQVSTWYDWGGIIGGIIGGVVSDVIGKRTPVVVGQLFLFSFALFFYTKSPNDTLINGLLMGVAGFFGNGAANLISAACSADLGRQPGSHGNAKALSTVTGIVDGTGSIGAALGQVLIPSLYQLINWNAVFYVFMFMIVLTILCLSKLCYKETREIITRFRTKQYQSLDTEESVDQNGNVDYDFENH